MAVPIPPCLLSLVLIKYWRVVDSLLSLKDFICSQYNLDFELPGRRVYSVALDPLFFKSGHGRRVMTGDDNKVTMHEKVSTLFNRYKQTTLGSPNDGPIKCIKWRGEFFE